MTAYADRVRWNPHRVDMSRAMFGVSITPLPDVVAPTLERLPADIGAQLKREFWKRHGRAPDWEKKHSAQDWLAAEVAEFEGEKVHRAFDEEEIRSLASRWSDLCMRMQRLEVMQDFARSVGIEPPEVKRNVTRVGAAGRLSCPRWWRRQIRKTYLRKAEAHLRATGFVHKRRQVYASDRAVENRRQRKARDRAMLQEMVAVSDAGDQLELWDVVQKSQANPALRRNELMVRLRGFEEVAQAAGHVAEFVTLTCPSAFHRMHVNGAKNEKWEGLTPRQGQQWLSKMWSRVRAKVQRLKVLIYGFRIAEPHHDGTPHWHAVFFVPQHHVSTLRVVIGEIWLSEYGDEAGARSHRAKFVAIDPAKGSACGYVAKYIAKNIDGFEVGDDYETNGQKAAESCDRVGAWASAHGIRQFQQIGGPPVTVWRELRRVREAGVHPAIRAAHAAADAGQWSEFIAALGGIERGRNGSVRLWTDHAAALSGSLNQYGELRGPQIAGVQAWHTDTSGTIACASGSACAARRESFVGAARRHRPRKNEQRSADASVSCSTGVELLHQCSGVMNPPQSAAGGCEARNLNTGNVIGMGHVDRAAKARPADAAPPPSLVRIRTREKIWRIQRKAEGQRAGHESRLDAGVADATGTGTAKRPALLPSLGPVSITVRGSKTMPGESSTGARGSGSIRGSPWTH